MHLDTSELMEDLVPRHWDELPDRSIIERFRTEDSMEVPFELTDLDIWANYTNDDLYQMDVKVREFLSKTAYRRASKGGYRTTAQVVFAWIFGHRPEPRDGYACRLVHKLLKYYCTSYSGCTTYKGKRVNRVYRFSPYSCTSKRPLSLRLRLEVANERTQVFKRGTGYREDKRSHGRQSYRDDGE